MTKFNNVKDRPAQATSPVVAESHPSGLTHEGGPGYARDLKSELFLLAVANTVSEDTFYEKADARDARFESLVAQVAIADPDWMRRFVGWLRNDANMRSASLVTALEAAHAMVANMIPGGRPMVALALQRADEPGEALAYWIGRYGRSIPKPIKRGIADAAVRLYNEYSLLKYDTPSHAFRFADVLDLTHPTAKNLEQGELFRYALDRRRGRGLVAPPSLPVIQANHMLRLAARENPAALLDAPSLGLAGFTWEDALSLAGPNVDKAELWVALTFRMGYMALLRNLRNFDEAGLPEASVEWVAGRLADPEAVAESRQFPFRFLAAYRNVPSHRWSLVLDKALTLSLANVPHLAGSSLILVDLSGSMADKATGKNSDMTRADVAKVFGAALAMRTDRPTLAWFNHESAPVTVPVGGSLLRLVDAFPAPSGGTDTPAAIRRWYTGQDRVIIVTDEQVSAYAMSTVDSTVPERVPLYTWNLAGYRYGHSPAGAAGCNRHTFGGLTDAAFRIIPLLEAHGRAEWPF